jgi:hypothetical protein
MSCASKNSSPDIKPKRTSTMVEKGHVWVWKEVMGNPNLYCWVPVSKDIVNSKGVDVNNVNIQDIPPPPNYEDIIAQLALESENTKQKQSLKKLQSPTVSDVALVSVDDPDKYTHIKNFIQRKGLKVYGGVAINSYLGKEDKFYNPRDIPDYDMLSPDPWNDAVELADELHKAGYKYVEARGGIHKGTYKVYANFWPVADITYMPQKEFEMIKTKTINGLKIVSPFKLLESMYKEFSEPYANPARWPKVATREKLLVKWTDPYNKRIACSKDLFDGGKVLLPEIHAKLLEESYKFIISKKMIFTGPLAYNTYMEIGGSDKRVLVDHYRILSENSNKDTKELFTKLIKIYKELEITTTFYPSRELNNTVYRIYAVINNQHVEICSITHLTSCTPYQYLLGRYITSIDYMKYDLLDIYLFNDSKKHSNDALCKYKHLTHVQNEYYKSKKFSELDKSPFQRFITKCRGPFQHNIKTEILNRWLEQVTDREKVIQKWTATGKIRIYPRKEVPKECTELSKDVCKYPCAWNKFIGRCQGIPKGTYRPGHDNNDLIYQYK